MRKATLLLLVLVTSAGCATTASVPVAPPLDDVAAKRGLSDQTKSRIYVLRRGEYKGSAILFRIAVDGLIAGGLAPATYRYFDVEPGTHKVLAMSNENEEVREFKTEAGREYFVVIGVRFGTMTARVGFDEAPNADREILRGSQLAKE